jgi:VanZ family protein
MAAGRRRISAWLAFFVAGFVVYASLYPFSAWRWPSNPWWAFVLAPMPVYWTAFDVVANLTGYFVWGLLLGSAWRGRLRSAFSTVAVCVALAAGLSGLLETLQNFLPSRVPSNLDCLLNTVGAGLGAATAVFVLSLPGVRQWGRHREAWLPPGTEPAWALLALWPMGLLVPLPVLFGQGQVLYPLREWLHAAVQGSALLQGQPALWWNRWVPVSPPGAPLPPLQEFFAVVVCLSSALLLVAAASAPGWRRAMVCLGAALAGVLVGALASAVTFGPQYAWAFWAAPQWVASGLAVLAALALCRAPQRLCALCALVALVCQVVLVNQAPLDPIHSLNLQAWEQGRFIRFFGVFEWVAWLWPFAALSLCWRWVLQPPRTLAFGAGSKMTE